MQNAVHEVCGEISPDTVLIELHFENCNIFMVILERSIFRGGFPSFYKM